MMPHAGKDDKEEVGEVQGQNEGERGRRGRRMVVMMILCSTCLPLCSVSVGDNRETYRLVLDEFQRTLEATNPHLYRQLQVQENFINQLAKAQRKARDEKGRKDAKEEKLKKLLASEDMVKIKGVESVPMPLDPSVEVSGGGGVGTSTSIEGRGRHTDQSRKADRIQ